MGSSGWGINASLPLTLALYRKRERGKARKKGAADAAPLETLK
jgi:hypothetical protein